MTVKQRLSRSNIYMFLIPLLIAAALLLVGAGIALYVLETVYLPKIGLSLQEMHITLEQYESMFAKFEVFLWAYLGAVGMALLLTIVFTNVFLTRSLFRHISEPLELLVAGVERVERGDLDTPIAYTGVDEFKAACDAVDLMAAKLKTALETEQHRQQSRKELIAGMSHDLKSPLTSIRAYSEALRDGVANTPAQRQRYIETICRKEQEIEEMVERLFAFSKLDLSEEPLDIVQLNVREAVSAIAADYVSQADVRLNALPDSPVLADSSQLRRIVKNILDNAVRYCGRQRPEVCISGAEREDMLAVSFTDNGPGVAPEALPKLFDVFYRTDPARDRTQEGSGLGLAIVKRAAEQMGGTAWAELPPDGGLRIVVTLKKGAVHE